MRIGIDFDNTIVSYDALFHKVAREQDLVPANTPVNKLAVRDLLRKTGRENQWTEMQGYVYGARMNEAEAYPGVINFMQAASNAGHTLAIISHKTRHPFLGKQYDLHAAAYAWINQHLLKDDKLLISESKIFFECTKPEKIVRITASQCNVFIDDLPEILQAEGFSPVTERILFDPEQHHQDKIMPGIKSFRNWADITDYLVA